MNEIQIIADNADLIVNGYAFTKCDTGYRGILTDTEISKIQSFIKTNYKEMYLKWAEYSQNGYYGK